MNKAVFLDRDGTVIADRGYLADRQGVELLPGAPAALRRLQRAGFLLFVITNQSGIGRGYFDAAAVDGQNRRLQELLLEQGVQLRDFFVCPHTPEDRCACRKPEPGMLLAAARKWDIDLSRSYMIGDKVTDGEAGRRAGCRTLLLSSGDRDLTEGEWQVADLDQAAGCILDHPHTVAVIPARYASTRFPGKALAPIAGKPMIQWVYERVREARLVEDILVATDDQRILHAVQAFGGLAVMTSSRHPTGTDRIVEAIQGRSGDLILNVQGDEPLLPGHYLDRLVQTMIESNSGMATVAVPFSATDADPDNPNLVKVVIDKDHRALYFSRSLIPFHRSGGVAVNPLLHWGIYAYRRQVLEDLVQRPQTPLEQCEMLEQLRVLENGVSIQVIIADQATIGVDVPEDVNRVEALMRSQ